MDRFSRTQLRDLAQMHQPGSVSLYLPTYRFESELAQNPIRLKNLLKEARQRLKEGEVDDRQIDATLQPAQDLLDNESYWHNMSDGMAAFLTPSMARFYRLPLQFEELAITGARFHLKPLFPLIASNNRFYILALSQNRVRLYLGTHYSVSEVHAHDIPRDIMDAVLKYEEAEQSVQFHTATKMGGPGGRHDNIMHGQGRQDDDVAGSKDLIYRFFRAINKGVQEVLHDEDAPLVLAGVSYYLPIYRAVNSYGHLVEDQIVQGNPEHLNPKELQAEAWKIVEPLFLENQQQSLEQFQQLYNTDGRLASDDLKEIIPAAVFSRIDTLFVPIGQHVWGLYDPDDNKVDLHEERQTGDDDLLDLAAVHTYLNGGAVHALQELNMPVEQELAATFRYPADVSAS